MNTSSAARCADSISGCARWKCGGAVQRSMLTIQPSSSPRSSTRHVRCRVNSFAVGSAASSSCRRPFAVQRCSRWTLLHADANTPSRSRAVPSVSLMVALTQRRHRHRPLVSRPGWTSLVRGGAFQLSARGDPTAPSGRRVNGQRKPRASLWDHDNSWRKLVDYAPHSPTHGEIIPIKESCRHT